MTLKCVIQNIYKIGNLICSSSHPEFICYIPDPYQKLIEKYWSQDPKD